MRHLDSTNERHQDVSVRMTVTLDKDVERLRREALHTADSVFIRYQGLRLFNPLTDQKVA